MDPEALREATEEWVEAGIVTAEQAAAIRAHERRGGSDADDTAAAPATDRSRLVVALSLMGASLVGAGLYLYLSADGDALPAPAYAAALVAAPPAFAAVGVALVRGRLPGLGPAPEVGHGVWFLAAAFVGPSAFLLAEQYAPDLGTEWLLAAWAAAAVPAARALDSRPTAALGGLTAVGALFAAAATDAAPFVAGLAGALLFAAGLLGRGRTRTRSGARSGGRGRDADRVAGVSGVAGAYELVGLAVVVLVLVAVGLADWRYERITLDASGLLVGVGLAAAAAAAAVRFRARRGAAGVGAEVVPGAARLAVVAAAAPVGAVLVAIGTPPLPARAAVVLVHALLLGLLVATVVAAVERGSRALVNLAAAGFLLGTGSFLAATVVDALSGAAALTVAGLVLLAAGLALERGRRELLGRITAG